MELCCLKKDIFAENKDIYCELMLHKQPCGRHSVLKIKPKVQLCEICGVFKLAVDRFPKNYERGL